MRERGRERDHYLAAIPSTAPTGCPRSKRRGTVIPNSITVHWEEVDCLDRNGAITGYVARALSNGREEGTASVDGDDREATLSGLTPSTQYSIHCSSGSSQQCWYWTIQPHCSLWNRRYCYNSYIISTII